MGDNKSSSKQQNHHHQHSNQVFNLSIDVMQDPGSKFFDDDGRIKRTGSVWTASAHIITAVIGSGVLSLAWAVAQLGWVAGPTVMFLFSIVTYYTSSLLADCYRSGDPENGKRNYTYIDVVRANLGGMQVKICGWIQYVNLFGVAIGYTIAASISMMAVKRSNCFHASGGKNPCHMSATPYIIIFGVAEIFLSQIPDFDQISWLSIVAAVMSFTYSTIGLGLGIAQVAGHDQISTVGVKDDEEGNPSKCISDNPLLHALWMHGLRSIWRRSTWKPPDRIRVLQPVLAPRHSKRSYSSPPFFNDIVGLLGALGFWPLTVYYPVEMYISQRRIPKWSTKWVCLQVLSLACLVITVAAAAGSIAGVIGDLKTYKLFGSIY